MSDMAVIPNPVVRLLPGDTIIAYERYEEIGHGGFAKVFRASADGEDVALKVTCKGPTTQSKDLQRHRTGVEIQRFLNHPHIVKELGFFEDSEFTYLVLELCHQGALKTLLRKVGKFSEEETIRYLRDITAGVAYLHSHRVIHRDLKLENFFLDGKGRVKIGDFGLSAKLEHDNDRKFSLCGTPNYLSPEMIEDYANGISYEVDIWALGVSTFAMLTGKLPFQRKDKKETLQQITKGVYQFPPDIGISPAAKEFVAMLLQIDPRQRPSAREILTHPFLKRKTIAHRKVAVSDPASTPVPDHFVCRFCDHSEKYGLGYLLLNGTVGACFNDSSRMVMDPFGEFVQYWDSYTTQVPEIILKDEKKETKKMTILSIFADSLKGKGSSHHLPKKRFEPQKALIHVKYWLRTEQGTLFRLDTRDIQLTFADRMKLLIFWNQKQLMLLPSVLGTGKLIPFSAMCDSDNRSDERMRYLVAKQMLVRMSK
jgi:polo-like kinase 1